MKNWTKSEKIGLLTLFVAVIVGASAFFIPEVRDYIGRGVKINTPDKEIKATPTLPPTISPTPAKPTPTTPKLPPPPTPLPSPPPVSTPLDSKTSNNLRLDVMSCKVDGNDVAVELIVTNLGEFRNEVYLDHDSTITNENRDRFYLAGTSEKRLITNEPRKVLLKFKNAGQSKNILILDLVMSAGKSAQFLGASGVLCKINF